MSEYDDDFDATPVKKSTTKAPASKNVTSTVTTAA
jgi:hypothetical protein